MDFVNSFYFVYVWENFDEKKKVASYLVKISRERMRDE